MKKYNELTEYEKKAALDKILSDDLELILSGVIRFDDGLNDDGLQRRIDAAIAEAERMKTPWFASEYILDACREELEKIAICVAEDALYPEPYEIVINGIIRIKK